MDLTAVQTLTSGERAGKIETRKSEEALIVARSALNTKSSFRRSLGTDTLEVA